MGARGPIAKRDIAPVVELHRGNPGKRKPNNTVRRKTPPSRPNPPKLSREARAEWNRVVPQLDELGLLNKVDRAVIATYCRAWARFVELEKILDSEGLVVVGHRGALRKNPAWQMWREAGVLCTQLAKDIGCTPAARLRMTLPDGDDGEGGDGILD